MISTSLLGESPEKERSYDALSAQLTPHSLRVILLQAEFRVSLQPCIDAIRTR